MVGKQLYGHHLDTALMDEFFDVDLYSIIYICLGLFANVIKFIL